MRRRELIRFSAARRLHGRSRRAGNRTKVQSGFVPPYRFAPTITTGRSSKHSKTACAGLTSSRIETLSSISFGSAMIPIKR